MRGELINQADIFSPSPLVVFRLVIESTFPRITAAFGRGFQNKGQAAFCFGAVGNDHTGELYLARFKHLETFCLHRHTTHEINCIVQVKL